MLDPEHKLYLRVNKELVSVETVVQKQDISRLRELLRRHVAFTGSKKGRAILEHFDERLADFKKIIPYDYYRMQMAIIQMEEKGLSSEQAQIEAFYANRNQ